MKFKKFWNKTKYYWFKFLNSFKIKIFYFDLLISNSKGLLLEIKQVSVRVSSETNNQYYNLKNNSMYVLNESFVEVFNKKNKIIKTFIALQCFIVTDNKKATIKGLTNFIETEKNANKKSKSQFISSLNEAKTWVKYYKNKALIGLKSSEIINYQYWKNQFGLYNILIEQNHKIKENSNE